jgi:nucleoside-diphosphate-sugar epimerase
MNEPILVTGSSGLIGRELLPVLTSMSNYVVTAGRSRPDSAKHRCCDLANAGEAAALIDAVRPGMIIHLAGGTGRTRQDLYRKNVLTTVHLLDAASRLEDSPYCIVIGSAAEYGNANGPIAESSPLRPVSEYGWVKLAQTTLADVIAQSAGLPLTILRPFNLVSPHLPQSSALGNMRQQLLNGSGSERTVECGRLDVIRDWVPVSAVAETIGRLITSPAPGETINVCSGHGLELGAILRVMAERLGVALRIIQRPTLLAIPAAPRVVGDPTSLGRLTGMRIEVTAESVAALVLQ